jgi:hypothetical protein
MVLGNPKMKMSERVQMMTLGETLVVMDPLSRGPLRHIGTFAKRVGGVKLNVALCLSRLGHGPAGRDAWETTSSERRYWPSLGERGSTSLR